MKTITICNAKPAGLDPADAACHLRHGHPREHYMFQGNTGSGFQFGAAEPAEPIDVSAVAIETRIRESGAGWVRARSSFTPWEAAIKRAQESRRGQDVRIVSA